MNEQYTTGDRVKHKTYGVGSFQRYHKIKTFNVSCWVDFDNFGVKRVYEETLTSEKRNNFKRVIRHLNR